MGGTDMARKQQSETKGGAEETRAELEALLEKLGEESLLFLKQQAEILLYSSELEEARRKAAEAARNLKHVQRSPRAEDTDAEPDEATAAAEPEPPVSVTRRGETSFFITMTGTRVFFNRQEMRELTRISHKATDAADGARRLHRWFARERSDFLKDTGASRAGDPRLQELWRIIVSTYKAPE
jgi:hypothetical protein